MEKINIKIKKIDRKKGFTLVETLVAVLVLSIAVAGAFSAAQTGLKTANGAKNQITAFYLAQDAFEYIRNMRDTAKLSDPENGFSNFRNDLSICSSKCFVDTQESGGLSACSSDSDCTLKINNGIYGSVGNSSSFIRTVHVTENSSNEVKVEVNLRWKDNGVSRIFEAEDLLLDWQ